MNFPIENGGFPYSYVDKPVWLVVEPYPSVLKMDNNGTKMEPETENNSIRWSPTLLEFGYIHNAIHTHFRVSKFSKNTQQIAEKRIVQNTNLAHSVSADKTKPWLCLKTGYPCNKSIGLSWLSLSLNGQFWRVGPYQIQTQIIRSVPRPIIMAPGSVHVGRPRVCTSPVVSPGALVKHQETWIVGCCLCQYSWKHGISWCHMSWQSHPITYHRTCL